MSKSTHFTIAGVTRMIFTLALKYGGLVFIAVVGVLQAAAAHNNLRGLLFFKNKSSAYLWAALTTGAALAAFFTWNYLFPTGIIEGSQQTGLFALSALAALIFTLIISSVVKSRFGRDAEVEKGGLEVLNRTSYFSALRAKYLGKR
jgi:hypothetical protein